MIVKEQELKDIAQSMNNNLWDVKDKYVLLSFDIEEVEIVLARRWGWRARLIKTLQNLNPGFISEVESDYFTVNEKDEVIINHENFRTFPGRSIVIAKVKVVVPEDTIALIEDSRSSNIKMYHKTDFVRVVSGLKDPTTKDELRNKIQLAVTYIR